MEEENETFAKQIHLPKALKKDLEDMAKERGNGNMKNMIQYLTINELAKYKQENKE